MRNFCIDCIHCHDTYGELPWYKKMFTLETEFSLCCDQPMFADQVTGKWMPCNTARVVQCNGLPPLFEARKK